jgi:tetratricopeptide (TPR) repeat protein
MKRHTSSVSAKVTPVESLPPARRRFFFVITILLPFLLVGVLELSLHLGGYGSEYNLIIKRRINGVEYYSVNRAFGRRYFAQPGMIVPEPGEDIFSIVKEKNTRRIFCLGESTMQGFPYEFQATPSSLLHDRLQAMLPQYTIEVVNVALSAVGSYVVNDMIGELREYQPDLFIVYLGHNEFYGIYGAGSSMNVPGGDWATRIALTLQRTRTFQLARSGYFAVRGWFSNAPTGPSPSLMGQMAGNKEILLHSPPYERARITYSDNLRRIIAAAKEMNVPILFSALVSNVGGQRPFVSMFHPVTTEGKRALWRLTMREGDSLAALGNKVAAIAKYITATRIDTFNADAFFRLGSALYTAGRFDNAREALLAAKDRDALRFRASEEFARDLATLCASLSVPLARTDSAFTQNSPHGITDSTLFLEHLHPNFDGYFLMARTIGEAIAANGFLARHHDWVAPPPDSVLVEASGVTEFDRTIGKVKIDLLKRRWPFETGSVQYEYTPRNPVESVVFRMLKGEITWSNARYLLAEYYARNGRFRDARRECFAVARALPKYYEPLLRVADYFVQEGLKDSAKGAYRYCFETDENPYAHLKLGALLLEEGTLAPSISQIEQSFAIAEGGKYQYTAEASALARYLLGVGYARQGRFADARQNLQRALAIQPDNSDARNLLRQIENRN